MPFPKGFVWGAASASYQVEGGYNEDGKGLSIWDVFCRIEGNIENNENGDTACDAYHRFAEDVQLLSDMGLSAYRFSVSWPRVMPDGRDAVNTKGLAYYDRLIDLLIEKGIEPYVTLYHWDLPLALEREGGWQSRSTAEAFAEYAACIAGHFNGRVKNYFTLNEPECSVHLGYSKGTHAPGKKLTEIECIACAHNLLLAHGLGVRAIRQNSAGKVNVGIASTGKLCYPQKNSEKNLAAAREASFAIDSGNIFFNHAVFLDPVILGRYPAGLSGAISSFVDGVSADDLAVISEPIDMLGVNIYNGSEVDETGEKTKKYPGFPRTGVKWPVTPEVMHYGIRWLYERYNLPIFITENGQACNDRIFLDGKIHDPDRIDFLHRYLHELEKVCSSGIPVKGYFHWSLTDNFEWEHGYTDRFGLVFVDYRTCGRIRKDSSYWYAEYISENTER